MIKVVTILGARPQFIKAATVSRAIRQLNDQHNEGLPSNNQAELAVKEVIIHTGQHYDPSMSEVFFQQLDIPLPDYNLGVSNLGHGAMTGRMMEQLETIMQKEQPDWVLVYGDTNSTLAGALTAAKLHLPIVHVEAGLRSHYPEMPEEINRILTDRVSTILCCPTQTAVEQLNQEGFPYPVPGNQRQQIHLTGDVMADAVIYYKDKAQKEISLDRWGLEDASYAICTLHRAENTDDLASLEEIFQALEEIASEITVVLPLHPRTKNVLFNHHKKAWLSGLKVIEPLPYLEMQRILMGAKQILTDSGGIQKEAYLHQVPCITLRNQTEWVETIDAGWNILAGTDKQKIVQTYWEFNQKALPTRTTLYGDGYSAHKIMKLITN